MAVMGSVSAMPLPWVRRVVGQLGAFPAVVAVHGVIPPGYGGDATNAMGFEHGEEFAHAVDRALGRCVAPVCEGVEEEAV